MGAAVRRTDGRFSTNDRSRRERNRRCTSTTGLLVQRHCVDAPQRHVPHKRPAAEIAARPVTVRRRMDVRHARCGHATHCRQPTLPRCRARIKTTFDRPETSTCQPATRPCALPFWARCSHYSRSPGQRPGYGQPAHAELPAVQHGHDGKNFAKEEAISGIDAEVVAALFKRAGIPYTLTLRFEPPAAAGGNARLRRVLLSRTPEREPKYKWVGPLSEIQIVLLKRPDSPIQISSPRRPGSTASARRTAASAAST